MSSSFFQRLFSAFIFVIGYEFLMSGLSKVFSSFVSDFHHELSTSIDGSYGIIKPILSHLVLPNASFFAVMAMITELAVGLGFILIPILAFKQLTPLLAKIGVVLSFVAAFYMLTLFFYSGDPFFVNPSDPYSESVSIDLFLALLNGVLFFYFLPFTKALKK